MTKEEYKAELKKLNVGEYVDNDRVKLDPKLSGSIAHEMRFRHKTLGIIFKASYSKKSIEELLTSHGIDASETIYEEIIKLIKEEMEALALKLIRDMYPGTFFRHFDYGYLELLSEKYPDVAKIVSNPNWRPLPRLGETQ